jgi:nitrile hydratase accessory protein
MAEARTTEVLDIDGPTAPPRRNGELVFEAPWESRLFGLTMSLLQAGVFRWEEFRELLIEEIGAWEATHQSEATWSYYERWQAAFEKLLAAKGLCGSAELDKRTEALAARPRGHDH